VTYTIRILLAAVLVAAVTCTARAEDYPTRTVTIIVPYPAGGPTDQVARILATKFSEQLGQTFVVENLSGGGTTIATTRVARAAPDGYTLLLHNLQISANVSLYPNLSFDTEKDLTPIGFINSNPLLLVGRKSLDANTFDELLAWMKTTPAKVAHFGAGSTAHLTTALFTQEAKLSVDQIPYRGAAPALGDLLGGHVDLFFATPQQVLGNVTAGQIKAYAITAKEKSQQFPTAASLVEALGPKLEITYWHAMFAPAGTPKPIIDKLNAAINAFVKKGEIVELWKKQGAVPMSMTSEEFDKFLRGDIAKWAEVVKRFSKS